MKNFTQIENSRIENRDISDGAFRTYLVIRSFKYGNKGRIFPSLKTIADRRGKSIRAIETHLDELRKGGWIKTSKRGYSMSSQYELIGVENFTPKWNKSSPQYGRKLPPNNIKDKNTEDKNRIPFGTFNFKGLEQMRNELIKKKVLSN